MSVNVLTKPLCASLSLHTEWSRQKSMKSKQQPWTTNIKKNKKRSRKKRYNKNNSCNFNWLGFINMWSWPTNISCSLWNNVKFPQESKNRKPKVFNDWHIFTSNFTFHKVTKGTNSTKTFLSLRDSHCEVLLTAAWPRYITLSGYSIATRHLIKEYRREERKDRKRIRTTETENWWKTNMWEIAEGDKGGITWNGSKY